jgi:hypothetical protein
MSTYKAFFKILFLICLSFSLLLGNTVNATPILEVKIPQADISLKYQVAPRLSQLLNDARNNIDYPPYHLGSSLLNLDHDKNNKIKTKKSILLKIIEDQAKTTSEMKNLHSIIVSLNLFYREAVSLDLEEIQLNAKLNPILKGHYLLSLPTRPNVITVIDPANSDKVVKVQLVPGYSLKNYLNEYYLKINKTNFDLPNNIELIQADKQHITPNIALWNNNKYFLSPGSIIFIGLDKSVKNMKEINHKFTALLQHHVAF